MRFRKFWVFLSLCLTCTVPLPLLAKEQLMHGETYHSTTANGTLLSEKLRQQLKEKYLENKSTKWLFNLIFTNAQASPNKSSIALHQPYEGKTIGLIQLHKKNAWNVKVFRWKLFTNTVLATTKDWIILDQLSFTSGDSIVFQQLIDSQARLNKLAHIKQAQITVQQRKNSSDMVDVRINTQDLFPINLDVSSNKSLLSIVHNNWAGWGHSLKNELLYNQGVGYGVTYRAPNIRQSRITGELQYRWTPPKAVRRLHVFKKFSDKTDHAGKIVVNQTRKTKWRILDGSIHPQKTFFSFHHQCIWLGTAIDIGDNCRQGRLFLTSKVTHQHFTQRPTTTQSTNRYFHHYIFSVGSVGFSNKRHYKDRLIYGVGSVESIPYGSKVNFIGGYQFGEFMNRPYFRIDLAQGKRIQRLGYLYGAVHVGSFWHKKAIEQGIVQLQLDYFTPLLEIGHQWIRQLIRINYLKGHNMLTGELISTNLRKVTKSLKDPFPGGTKRLHLSFETVLLALKRFAGCQVAALGFLEAVKLEDAQGKIKQSSFCKVLGLGLRCAHPRLTFGPLQIRLGYSPLTQSMYFAINTITGVSNKLEISEPGTISFQEY